MTAEEGRPAVLLDASAAGSSTNSGSSKRSLYVLHCDETYDLELVEELRSALQLPEDRFHMLGEPGAGELIVDALVTSVVSSYVTVVVSSRAFWVSGWARFANAVATHHAAHGGRLVPLLREDFDAPLLSSVYTTLSCTTPERKQHAFQRIRELLDQPEPSRPEVPCPYHGSRPYEERDGERLGGRGGELDGLLARIAGPSGAGGVREVYLSGPSGTGKTSLVRAGLAARLRRGGGTVGAAFEICHVEPGGGGGEAALAEAARMLASTTARVLVIVDPLERLLVPGDEPTSQRLLAQLQRLRTEPRCHLLWVVRSDALPALRRSDLGESLSSALHHRLAPLSARGLREAIAMPAQAAGVVLAPTLVDVLVTEVEAQPGALTLLQDTLARLWEQRLQDYLSTDSYVALGGGTRSGLIATAAARADVALHKLAGADHGLALRILTRLVRTSGGARSARSRRRSELDDGADATRTGQVLEHLVTSRLLVAGDGQEQEEATYELAHHALITAWPRLREWIDRHHADEARRDVLDERAEKWQQRGRLGGLLDEVELIEYDRWCTPGVREAIGVSARIDGLVAASRAALERAAEEQRRAEAERRAMMARYHVAKAQSLLRGGRGAQAVPYLAAARELGHGGKALELLAAWARRALPIVRLGRETTAMAWGPDGRLAFADVEGVHVWQAPGDEARAWHGSPDCAEHLAWSAAGRWLAVAKGTELQLWDAQRGERVAILDELPFAVEALSWSHDGQWLAASCGEARLWIWRMDQGIDAAPSLLSEVACDGQVSALAWSLDGRLAVAMDRCVRIRLLDEARWQGALAHDTSVRSLAWSHDGHHLASIDRAAHVWELRTQTEKSFSRDDRRERGCAIAWDPHGACLALAGDDGTARLWNVGSRKVASPLFEHGGELRNIGWDPSGQRIATLGTDVCIWGAEDAMRRSRRARAASAPRLRAPRR